MNIKNQPYLNNRTDLNILYIINDILLQRNLIKPNQRLLIAVSGGQDSMFIIKMILSLKKEWNWKLGIVNCDHGWNSMSKLQSIYVSEIAQNIQIDYYQSICTKTINCERSARHWRYQTIQRIAYTHNYKLVITAHNASDRIETLIYNMSRGSGMSGIQALTWKKSIYETKRLETSHLCKNKSFIFNLEYVYQNNFTYLKNKNIQIIRPLLSITRTQIRRLLLDWKFPVWSDPTNNYCKLRRNLIRKLILPYMRYSLNSRLDPILSQWTELLNGENIFFTQLANSIRLRIETIIIDNKNNIYIILNLHMLCSLPIALQRKIIQQSVQIHTKTQMIFHHIEHIRLTYTCHNKKLGKYRYNFPNFNSSDVQVFLHIKKLEHRGLKIYLLRNNMIIQYQK